MAVIRLKKGVIVIILLFAAGWAYIAFVNRNRPDMTIKQKILNAVYPAIMAAGKLFGKNDAVLANKNDIRPRVNFYELSATDNKGNVINFNQFKGKNVLLVNTASACGYTGQYADLEKLQQQFKNELVIIGFPANDFKEQEKGNDEEIAEFCKVNFGISFPLIQKSQVVKGAAQNKVYTWLTDAKQNGWCNQQPTWNFSKYLVNKEGTLTAFFNQTISPMDEVVLQAITP